MKNPLVFDLFSGCGGMSWGLHKAGFDVIGGLDNYQPAIETFRYNHKNAKAYYVDITTVNPTEILNSLNIKTGELDCLIGGPPCQGFSKNVPAAYRFLEDPRNQLFLEFLLFVKEFRPKTIVLENVAEIYNAYNGAVRNEIEKQLTIMGYAVNIRVIYMPDYGIPQRRRRCFFFASRTGIKPEFPSPLFGEFESKDLFSHIKPYRSAWSAISDLPVLQNNEGYEPMEYDQPPLNEYQELMRKDNGLLYDHIAKNLKPTQLARLSSIGPGEGLKELPDHLRPKSGFSGAYGRLDFKMLAPTITRWVFHPGSGRFGHPREKRLLTIREAARLQSFSDDFRFTGSYTEKASHIGNAVPPMIMEVLSNHIRYCLGY